MNRSVSKERRSVLCKLIRGEISSADAASDLGISRSSVNELRRRYLKSKLPRTDGDVKGAVDSPVSVSRDQWGVTHIRANSTADCYYALGYAMAQDRLWQMDYRRRLARGRVAEVLGPAHLKEDRLNRTIGLGRSADLSTYSEEVEMVLGAFSTGVNTWIEARSWPVEFDLLEYEPELWSASDSVACWKWRWWTLTGRLENIVVGEAARIGADCFVIHPGTQGDVRLRTRLAVGVLRRRSG